MKIALLTRFFNEDNGGVGVYSKNLLRELLEQEYNIDLFSTSFKNWVGYFFYTSTELGLKLQFHNADIYHALTPLEAVWAPKEKTIVTYHDLMPWKYRNVLMNQASSFSSSLRKWAGSKWFELASKEASRAKRILCNSSQTKREVMDYLNVEEERITVTRMGISSELKPIKTEHDNYRIGTLSYLDPRKRIDILIRAFKKIDDPNAELLIPSTGPDKNRLKKIASNDDRIIFLGPLPENKKAEYLSSLDVFCLCSRLEGYGIPIVESMRCKTPVITLNDALVPSDVQSKTKVVEKKNLSKVLRKKEFGNKVKEGFEFSLNHSWKNCAEKTAEVYRSLSNSK